MLPRTTWTGSTCDSGAAVVAEKNVNPEMPTMVMATAVHMGRVTLCRWMRAAIRTDQGTARMPTGCTTVTGAIISA